MIQFHGKNFIGSNLSAKGKDIYYSYNPRTNQQSSEGFTNATIEEINTAFNLASAAFKIYRKKSSQEKAKFLENIAEEILNLGDILISTASEESGLTTTRIDSERARTISTLRMFAEVAREGSWVEARIDTAIPDRKPLPKPDLRRMLIPLGPVVVFGASNFPLAFSVAGGDTASALAAGNPVIVKVHPAHPKTSELVATAIIAAAKKSNMPEGIFSLIQGSANEIGKYLVEHSAAEAVGFTGSLKGGRALYDIATKRTKPIPVYAEMGSTNPVFFLPGALKERAESIAMNYQESFTRSCGQMCTKPGITFALNDSSLNNFKSIITNLIQNAKPETMLHSGIAKSFYSGIDSRLNIPGVRLLASAANQGQKEHNESAATLFETDFLTFFNNHLLSEENFGPSSILVNCNSKDEFLKIANNLEGHLSATIHGTKEDLIEFKELIDILETKTGRIIFNGFPTGLEVCNSITHGGPYPATTDSRTTSVGTAAISRFARPITFQNFPEEMLPIELKNKNELNILRLVNNKYTKDYI